MSKLAKGLLTLLIGRERVSVKEWKRSQHSSNQTRRMWRESDSKQEATSTWPWRSRDQSTTSRTDVRIATRESCDPPAAPS